MAYGGVVSVFSLALLVTSSAANLSIPRKLVA